MNAVTPLQACRCDAIEHEPKLIVLTGGPGAGKTAVLEIARRYFCAHVAVLPEAASIVFGGGFMRGDSLPARKAAQRAIFHVQRELEQMAIEERRWAVVLCDRGTVDGLAYWPNSEGSFWAGTGTDHAREIARYAQVIHLRTPSRENGYNRQNPVRIESVDQAATIDVAIEKAWADHPNRHFIESSHDFVVKAAGAMRLLSDAIPECCRAR